MHGKTVLFADDEQQYIEALVALAEGDGARVLTCRTASKAIAITTSQKIDCLVIDVMMDPGKDLPHVDPQRAGIEAIGIIRKTMPNQAIVCFSVLSNQDEVERLKRMGVLFMRKAETSLDKAWRIIASKATGLYSV
jgi:CheY-like chemotaxis protein